MFRSILCLASLGTGVVGQVNVEIPLRKSLEGLLIANVSIPTAGVRYVDMILSIEDITRIADPSGVVDETNRTLILNSHTTSALSFSDNRFLVHTGEEGFSYLAIGPESVLTRSYGAVAIVRNYYADNSAKLIV